MPASGTQAIDRAAELLSRVVLADEPVGQADLVAETGLAKSTASRLLTALERHRLLLKDDAGGYRAGPLFALYATRHEPAVELTRLAQPTLELLGRETGETINLAVLERGAVVQVAQVDATYLLGTTNWVGVDVPPHASALGKVFYAEGLLPVPAELAALTERTITSPSAFARELRTIRAQGYAVTRGELEIGLDAVAAPVRDDAGTTVASVGISGPSDRVGTAIPKLAELITTQAGSLSALLTASPAHAAAEPDHKEGAA